MKTLSILLMLTSAPLAATAAAQEVLEEAKAQYAAAAYEEALSTLTRVDTAAMPIAAAINKVELEQYRAFCFIALGKIPDAEKAVAALVATDPKYVPSPTVASPRVLQIVSEMRRKELPAVARRLFEEGKSAFKEKQLALAQRNFDLLLELLDDPALKGRPENDDMRVLAEGFVALTTAAAAPPPKTSVAAAETPAPAPASAAVPVATTGTLIQPPVAVSQTLPEWNPPDRRTGRDYVGSIKVLIGADGRVKSAAIEKPTFPAYDARLLQAAKLWVYKPATRNGAPVESEKIIAVQLRQRD
jgi:tetratricopeptide (TPR) repeat protein